MAYNTEAVSGIMSIFGFQQAVLEQTFAAHVSALETCMVWVKLVENLLSNSLIEA